MVDEGRRAGAVLVLCILLVLALALLGHGALIMAREDLAVSAAGADLLRARAAAEAGIADVLDGDGSVPPDTMGRGVRVAVASGAVGDAHYRVAARRLSREIWLLQAEGSARPDVWVAREAQPVWSLDAGARVAAFTAVVEVGSAAPVTGASRIRSDGTAPQGASPDAQACAAWRRLRDSLGIASLLPPLAAIGIGDAGTAVEPTLGLLRVGDLLSSAQPTVTGAGTPSPLVGPQGCRAEGAWNWGDPDDPTGACHELSPLIGATGSVEIDGGVGQGVLVSRGDVILTGGARFYGLVLARGALTLRSGSQLVGLARAVGGLAVAADAQVDVSRCWAYQALRRVRAILAHPVPLPGVGRIGPY